MPVSSEDFKTTLASWPSGVTVVASHHQGIAHAMTVSSFCSVSLQPPLISVCLAHDARTLALLKESRVFAVSVLSQLQAGVSNACASHETEGLQSVAFHWARNQCPLITGASAHLECAVHDLITAGDHTLVLGTVTAVDSTSLLPLLYCNRTYGTFSLG